MNQRLLRVRAIGVAMLLCAWSTLAMAQSAAPATQNLLERMRAVAVQAAEEQTLPGISVAVHAGPKADLVSFTYGWADVAAKRPVTPQTMFRLASISKPMTAVAAMELARDKRLNLDAPAESYCPAFSGHPEVTGRMLLAHRSGVHHYKSDEAANNTRHFDSLDAAVKNFAADKLEFAAGSAYQYSSYGYAVVGCEIEGASHQRYESFVRETILQPLHMEHTVVDDARVAETDKVRFYSLKDGHLVAAHALDTSDRLPGGGWLGTPTDLVKFGLGAQGLLGEAWAREMWREVTPEQHYALGWGVEMVNGHAAAQHSGGQAGTSTFLMVVPDQDLAIAVFTNRDGADMRKVAHKLYEVLTGAK